MLHEVIFFSLDNSLSLPGSQIIIIGVNLLNQPMIIFDKTINCILQPCLLNSNTIYEVSSTNSVSCKTIPVIFWIYSHDDLIPVSTDYKYAGYQ